MSNRVGGPRGDAIIKVKNESGRALSGQLTYTPSPAGAYEVRAGANRSAAEAAEVVRTDDEGKTYGPASHTEAYIRIVPAAAVIPDVPDTDASSGAVGAVIVGTAIGGAAAFVGYEIATDIILRDLLPAGADIPVNRGQLAWLIWGRKGRTGTREPARLHRRVRARNGQGRPVVRGAGHPDCSRRDHLPPQRLGDPRQGDPDLEHRLPQAVTPHSKKQ